MKIAWRYACVIIGLSVLLPVRGEDAAADKIDGLIRNLTSEEFKTREEAMQALRALGHAALPQIVRAIEATQDAEQKQRLNDLSEPQGLRWKGDLEWIKTYKLADELKGTLEKYLSGKDEERGKAEEELLGKAPYMALAVRLLIGAEKDAARRERLYELKYLLLSDSPRRAAQILRYAHELLAVAAKSGPLGATWEKKEQLCDRSKAKFFHACFIDPKIYGDNGLKELTEGTHMHAPDLDLSAAAQVYLEAKAMYERLAKNEKNPDKAKEYAQGAEAAAKGAKEASLLAEITD